MAAGVFFVDNYIYGASLSAAGPNEQCNLLSIGAFENVGDALQHKLWPFFSVEPHDKELDFLLIGAAERISGTPCRFSFCFFCYP